MFHRLINPIKTNSFFIFGPRGTGKSTFLKHFLGAENKTLWIDLLDPATEDTFARNPSQLSALVQAKKEEIEWVVIDEIQKQPKLLDATHQLIESTSVPLCQYIRPKKFADIKALHWKDGLREIGLVP